MKNSILLPAFLILFFQVSSYVTVAQSAGDLDVSFGNNGKVITPVGTTNAVINAVALQTDGKIVVAGCSFNGTDNDFTVARYNTDGSLDNTFSSDGIVTTDAGGFDKAWAVTVQTDGKIVAAGTSYHTYAEDFTVVRYNSDGSLDNTFSSDGIVTTDIANYADIALAVTIQTDGKILTAGRSSIGSFPRFTLVRYNTDGTLDNTFATGGIATTVFGSSSIGASLALQQDGKIVVAGQTDDGLHSDFAVVRYNTDGSPDITFSADGIVTTPVTSENDAAHSVVIQQDGKIVVAGESDNSIISNFTIVRYNTDGSLDNAFSTDGIVTTSCGNSSSAGYSAALQTDGKILLTGLSDNGINFDFAVARYNTDGSLDSTFSSDGITLTDMGNFGDYSNAIAIQPDGNIVVAGSAYNGSDEDFAVVRYLGSTTISVEENIENIIIKIYPNPADNKIEIESPQNTNIEIINPQGQVIKTILTKESKTAVDLTGLSAGIYFIKARTSNKVEIKKLIKQ